MTNTRYNTLDKDNSTSFTHISVEINQSLACTRSPTCRKILSKPRSPKVPGHASPSPKEDATWTWMFIRHVFQQLEKNQKMVGFVLSSMCFFSYQPFRYPLDIPDVFDSTCFFLDNVFSDFFGRYLIPQWEPKRNRCYQLIPLMEEILQHLGSRKPCNQMMA